MLNIGFQPFFIWLYFKVQQSCSKFMNLSNFFLFCSFSSRFWMFVNLPLIYLRLDFHRFFSCFRFFQLGWVAHSWHYIKIKTYSLTQFCNFVNGKATRTTTATEERKKWEEKLLKKTMKQASLVIESYTLHIRTHNSYIWTNLKCILLICCTWL